MHAEILSYSRSRGVFGGIDLSGNAVSTDEDTNQELYGKKISNQVQTRICRFRRLRNY